MRIEVDEEVLARLLFERGEARADADALAEALRSGHDQHWTLSATLIAQEALTRHDTEVAER